MNQKASVRMTEQILTKVEDQHPIYNALIYASVWLFPPVMLAAVIGPGLQLFENGWGWSLLILIPTGLLASDFVSGLFHWFFDNYGSPSTPVFGQTIELFRVHHDLPEDICNSNFAQTNGHVCLWSVPMIAGHLVAWAMLPPNPLFSAWLVFFSTANLFLILTNQFHKWAHLPQKPALILWMQQKGLILESQHHQIHHTVPYDRYYCITTGWLNPLLYKLKFFPRAEAVLAKLGLRKSHSA